MHFNVKSIIDGYKSCRSFKYRIKHTLNKYWIFISKSNGRRGAMVSVLSLWFLHPAFEPRCAYNFIFHKISWLKGHWNVPAIQSTEWSLNGGWNATEIHLSCHHSVAIQTRFSNHSVDWKVRFHPVWWNLIYHQVTLYFISMFNVEKNNYQVWPFNLNIMIKKVLV